MNNSINVLCERIETKTNDLKAAQQSYHEAVDWVRREEAQLDVLIKEMRVLNKYLFNDLSYDDERDDRN